MYLFAVSWLKLMDTRRLRLLLFYNWIVACTLFAGVNGGKPDCHNLKDRVVLTDDADICVTGRPELGSPFDPVVLDFSTAKKEAFELLTKGFTDLLGAFVMDGNEQVETLNFGQIKLFDGKKLPAGSNFISIRNNPNLKKLEWNASVSDLILNDIGQPLHVLIFNNPQLDVASFKMISDSARSRSKLVRSIQDSVGECRFQNEHNDAEYFPPTAGILKNCKKIKGDFKMTGGSLAGLSIQLTRDSCLQLINVDMTEAKLTLNAGKLSPTCKDKSTSKISNNKKLCGYQLKRLEESFNKPEDVAIEQDKPSCTIECTPEQMRRKYYICNNQVEATTADSTTTDSTKNNNNNNNNNNGNNNNNNGNASKNQQNAKDPPWVIIGCCVAGLVLIVLIIIFVFWKKKMLCFKKKRKQPKQKWVKRTKDEKDTWKSPYAGRHDDTFGYNVRQSAPKFIMDLLDINTLRNKFAAVDKIVVDEKTREKPPAPWKSSEGTALGSLVMVYEQEYLIGPRPKDKETATAFWEYACDNLVCNFIMIGEAGNDFMPAKPGETMEFGTMKMTLEKEESPVKLYTTRTVKIKRTVNGKRCEWKVVVNHLACWTGDIPPSMKEFYHVFYLLEQVDGTRQGVEIQEGTGLPKDAAERRMILCPDGKERTAALLLLEMVWGELLLLNAREEKEQKELKPQEKGEKTNPINIEGLLARLRTQIPSAISNFRLYLFLHLLIVKRLYKATPPPDAPYPQKFVEEAFAALGLKDESKICEEVKDKTSTTVSKEPRGTKSGKTTGSSQSSQ